MNDSEDWCHFKKIYSMAYGSSYTAPEPTNLITVSNSFGIIVIAQVNIVNLYYTKTFLSCIKASKPLVTFTFDEQVSFLCLSKDCSLLAVGQKTQLSLINLKNNEKSLIKLETNIKHLEFKNNKLGLLQGNNKFDLYESDKSVQKMKNVEFFTFVSSSKHIIIAQDSQIKKISLDSMNIVLQCPIESPILSLKENLGQVFAYAYRDNLVHIIVYNSSLEQIEDISNVSLIDDGVDPILLNDMKNLKVFFEFIEKRQNMVFTTSISPSIEMITLNETLNLVNFEENYEGHGYLDNAGGGDYLKVFKGFGLVCCEHDAEVDKFEYMGENYDITKPPILACLDNEGMLTVFAVVDLRREYLGIESCVEVQYSFNLCTEVDRKSDVEENKKVEIEENKEKNEEKKFFGSSNSIFSPGLVGFGNSNESKLKSNDVSQSGTNIFSAKTNSGLITNTEFIKPETTQLSSLNTEKSQANPFTGQLFVSNAENSLNKPNIFGQPSLSNQIVFGASSTKPALTSPGSGFFAPANSETTNKLSNPQTSLNLTQTETGGLKAGFFVKSDEKDDKKPGGWMSSNQAKLPENFKLLNTEEKKPEIFVTGFASNSNEKPKNFLFGDKEVKNEPEKISQKSESLFGGFTKADSQGVKDLEIKKTEQKSGLFSFSNSEPGPGLNLFGNANTKIAQNVESGKSEQNSGFFNFGKTEQVPRLNPFESSGNKIVHNPESIKVDQKPGIFNVSNTELKPGLFQPSNPDSQPFKILEDNKTGQKGLLSFSNTGSTPGLFGFSNAGFAPGPFQSEKTEIQGVKNNETQKIEKKSEIFNNPGTGTGLNLFQSGSTAITLNKPNTDSNKNSEFSFFNAKQSTNAFSSVNPQNFSNFGMAFNTKDPVNSFLAPQNSSKAENNSFILPKKENFPENPSNNDSFIPQKNDNLSEKPFSNFGLSHAFGQVSLNNENNSTAANQNVFNANNQTVKKKLIERDKYFEQPLRFLVNISKKIENLSDLYKFSGYPQINGKIFVLEKKFSESLPELFSASQKNRDLTLIFTNIRKEISQNKGNNFNSLLNLSYTKNTEILSNMEKQLENLRATTNSLQSLLPTLNYNSSQNSSIKVASILLERRNLFRTKLESLKEKLLLLNMLAKSSNPDIFSLWQEHVYNFIDPKEYKSLYSNIVIEAKPSQSSQLSKKKSSHLSYEPIKMQLNLSDLNIQPAPIRKKPQSTSFIQNLRMQQENLLKEIQSYQASQGKNQSNSPNSLTEKIPEKNEKVPQSIPKNTENIPSLTEIKPQVSSSNMPLNMPKPAVAEIKPNENLNPAGSKPNPFSGSNPTGFFNTTPNPGSLPPPPSSSNPPIASNPVQSTPSNSFFVNKPAATSSSLSQLSTPLANNPFSNPALSQLPASQATNPFPNTNLSQLSTSLASNPFANAGFGQQSSFVSPNIPKMDGIANKSFGVSSNPLSGFGTATISNPQPHEPNRQEGNSFYKPRK